MTIRLNKVTRDLNVGISTVVEFLQKKGFTVEANPNTKISEEQYALLVKEFSTDKNLRLESERFIQERQNKDRNKASVAIDGYEAAAQVEKPKADDVIKTVIPEDIRPKFKPVGKIDLDKLNHQSAPPEKPIEEIVEKPLHASMNQVEEKIVVVAPEPVHEEEIVEPAEVVVETIEVVEEKPVEVVIPVPEKKANTEKVYKEEKIIEKPSEKEVIEETKKEVETVKASEENEIFTLHKPEFVSKINIIGQID